MPRFRITFNDGSSIEKEAANGDLAKQAAKRESQQKSGALTRTDPRVKVAHVVNLDEDRGPTDPRNTPLPGAGAPRSDRDSSDRSDRDRSDASRRDRDDRGNGRDDRDRRETEARDREDRERRDREDQDRRDREERERREREGGR